VAKTYEYEFDAPPEELFTETLSAVNALGFSILHNEDTETSVTFNTGPSIWSAAGQDMTATAFPLSPSSSRLVVTGKTARRGEQAQYGSWGERGRIAKGLATRVRGTLPELADGDERDVDSGHDPNPDSAAFVVELAILCELHRNGDITDDEFGEAKQRLFDR
jgi:hypothetical protein